MRVNLRIVSYLVVVGLLLGACGGSKVATSTGTPALIPQAAAPESGGPALAAELVDEARGHLDRDDLDQAIEVLNRAVTADSSSPEAHFMLGNAYTRRGRLSEAEAAYRLAMSMRPDDADTLSNLGVVLYRQLELDEAVDMFRRALKLMPDDPEIQYNLGGALFAQERVPEAIEAFEAARAKRPDLAQVHLGLGFAYKEVGDLDKAAESFRQYLELSDDAEWTEKARQELDALGVE